VTNIIVGNWKMNQDLNSIKEFFTVMDALKFELNCEAWVAPQMIHLPIVKEFAFSLGKIKVGAQNAHYLEDGAFTGETSPRALKDLGAHFVILGHSERRALFNETDELINKKMNKALGLGLKAILCVGESLEQRKSGQTLEVISKQVQSGLAGIDSDHRGHILIAYEPVWAIGTGETATPQQAEEVHHHICHQVKKLWNKSHLPPLLYGGSVKPSNIRELLSQKHIHGALVGGASLKGADFKELCLVASETP